MADEKFLPRLAPEFGDKQKFRPDEVQRILGIEDPRTLRALDDREIFPIETAPRKRVYPRAELERYLQHRNNKRITKMK